MSDIPTLCPRTKVPHDFNATTFIGKSTFKETVDLTRFGAINVSLLKEHQLFFHFWVKLFDKLTNLFVSSRFLTAKLITGKGEDLGKKSNVKWVRSFVLRPRSAGDEGVDIIIP